MFAKSYENSKGMDFLYKILKPFTPYTFGIYLVHIYIQEILIKKLNLNIASLKHVIFLVIAVFIISFILNYIMKKIPIIKKIVP